ncbi:type 2 isopentenyl-diphosphate Delta-isomerase [Chlorobaculum sp. 24CR]|uniref:type 2 isopentenyl-diphosphate Delta-isomerase n=1 Tax=Chlorobaculum sp. 24CR TaxID=2508878 RepID=UPI00100AF680|nr:type 2 isopentenyl-diphosphate Delta-isomerase [Chlorobaculum sp. 24CR]RXK88689.1 type 2 isopentenyl-diphosphate Delta-isomerase [Chlorobaculum sp. 24CR]
MQEASAAITAERKHSHVDICLNREVCFDLQNTGLGAWRFQHNAIPEIDASAINLSTEFLGKKIGLPLMISSMTGGYGDALALNRTLAEAAERFGIPLGVGSMRQALEGSSHRESFSVVRKSAPTAPIYANIGAPEVAAGLSRDQLSTLIDLIEADALIVHLNPAQELFQPEGDTNFSGFLDKLSDITATIGVPVIAKEVGCGISPSAARKLADAGVRAIDVAGAGGISWQKVEEHRYIERFSNEERFSPSALDELLNWGIPTSECLTGIAALKQQNPEYGALSVISSGGIGNGLDVAKSIALGANIAASARRMLIALHAGTLDETIRAWANDLKAAMFLTGSASIEELKQAPINHKP